MSQQPPPRSESLFSEFNRKLLHAKPGPVGILKDRHAQSTVLRFAKSHGIKVQSRKINGRGIGIWKLA